MDHNNTTTALKSPKESPKGVFGKIKVCCNESFEVGLRAHLKYDFGEKGKFAGEEDCQRPRWREFGLKVAQIHAILTFRSEFAILIV